MLNRTEPERPTEPSPNSGRANLNYNRHCPERRTELPLTAEPNCPEVRLRYTNSDRASLERRITLPADLQTRAA
jgi:hypothetical protein